MKDYLTDFELINDTVLSVAAHFFMTKQKAMFNFTTFHHFGKLYDTLAVNTSDCNGYIRFWLNRFRKDYDSELDVGELVENIVAFNSLCGSPYEGGWKELIRQNKDMIILNAEKEIQRFNPIFDECLRKEEDLEKSLSGTWKI